MSKPIIIYVPGLLSTGYLHSLSLKARMFFLRRGYEFRVVHAKPAGSIEERAEPIIKTLQEIGRAVHLVSHSMGCLSSRYVASKQPFHTFIKTCTMISGPHRGSIFADKYAKELPREDDNALERAYKQLTSNYMENWNKLYQDNPQVKYYSLGFTNDSMVTPESALWGTSLGVGDCPHLKQMSPYFGGQFFKNMKIVIDNLDSL